MFLSDDHHPNMAQLTKVNLTFTHVTNFRVSIYYPGPSGTRSVANMPESGGLGDFGYLLRLMYMGDNATQQ